MMWFKNLKFSRKLIIGFLIVAIIAAIVGVVGTSFTVLKDAVTGLYQEVALGLQYQSCCSQLQH
jgi:methyl-accepting chemotaxis protein